MNQDRSQGNWKQLTCQVGQHWDRLTDDDLDRIGPEHEQRAGKSNKRYSIAEEEVELRLRSKSTRTNHKWPQS